LPRPGLKGPRWKGGEGAVAWASARDLEETLGVALSAGVVIGVIDEIVLRKALSVTESPTMDKRKN
jgi:hypothetical protein